MRKPVKIGLVVIVILILLVASMLAVLLLDLTSYVDTSSRTLNPTGDSIGRVLVVFDPGFSGVAKQDAASIAQDFQAKGYTVVLAGVHSGVAGDSSGYGIVVAGGPMYWGQVSSSIDAYLKAVPNSVSKGVFASTGGSAFVESDYELLQSQVGSTVVAKLVLDGNQTGDCADFVSKLT